MTETATNGSGAAAEVIVVGGGPAGAATAYMLARSGIDVLVVDRAHFPRDKPCAEYVSPQASRILCDMGALEEIEAAGAAHLSGMMVRAPSGTTFRGNFAAEHGFRGFRDRGLALRRPVFDTILLRRAAAAGARVMEGVTVTDVSRDPRGRITGIQVRESPDAESNGGPATEFSGRITVGADGLRSVIARRAGLARHRLWPRRVAFVTHYDGVSGMGSAGEMHVEHDGYIGLADVGNGETNVALVVPARLARGAGSDRVGFLSSWIGRRPHLVPRFHGAQRTSPVRATGPFAQHARRGWTRGAALVGDAADFFDPFTGEGIYAALRGAELLTPYLYAAVRSNSGRDADIALAAYDRCRVREFRGKWMVEQLVAAAVSQPAILEQAAQVLARRPEMADLFVGVTGDFVPPAEILRMRYLLRLLLPTWLPHRAV